MSSLLSASKKVVVEIPFHSNSPLSLESGWIAKQAGGAVVVRQGDTMVLVTVCSGAARPDQNFFPLSVDYQEKAYAAGKIPGDFLDEKPSLQKVKF